MHPSTEPLIVSLITLIGLLIALGVLGWYLSRRAYATRADHLVVVRCRAGHLFTTIWVPFMSFKAIRLGNMRFQRCPVGDHWTFVVPVDDLDLSADERREAAQHRDTNIP